MSKCWADEMGRLWRAPDKPMSATWKLLTELEAKGAYVAEAAYEGRTVVALIDDSGVTAYSPGRNQQTYTREALDSIRRLGFPGGTALALQWVAKGRKTPVFVLLDVLHLGWEWQGAKSFVERSRLLDGMRLPPGIETPERVTGGFLSFFEQQVGDGDPSSAPTTGIVLKHLQSTLVGGPMTSVKNPLWCEVLWRQGPNGQDVVYRRCDRL